MLPLYSYEGKSQGKCCQFSLVLFACYHNSLSLCVLVCLFLLSVWMVFSAPVFCGLSSLQVWRAGVLGDICSCSVVPLDQSSPLLFYNLNFVIVVYTVILCCEFILYKLQLICVFLSWERESSVLQLPFFLCLFSLLKGCKVVPHWNDGSTDRRLCMLCIL